MESIRPWRDGMNRRVIVISGYLASGKSTFARRLSRELSVPCLVKDTFKIAICRHLTVADRAEKSRFSAATFDAMLYVLERMFEAGQPVMIEGNFVPAGVKEVDEAGELRQLIDAYGYGALTYRFTGDTRVLHRRFMARESTADRGEVNRIGSDVPHETFDQWCHNLDGFDVGGRIVDVDTTDFDRVDFARYAELAQQFMNQRIFG